MLDEIGPLVGLALCESSIGSFEGEVDGLTYVCYCSALEQSGLVWCGVNKMVNVNRHCTKPLSPMIHSPLLVLVIHNTLQCA